MKWLWLAIAGALGLWLIVLLIVSPPRDGAQAKPKSPFDGVSTEMPGVDAPAVEAFSKLKRPALKATKRSVPFPAAPDQRQGE